MSGVDGIPLDRARLRENLYYTRQGAVTSKRIQVKKAKRRLSTFTCSLLIPLSFYKTKVLQCELLLEGYTAVIFIELWPYNIPLLVRVFPEHPLITRYMYPTATGRGRITLFSLCGSRQSEASSRKNVVATLSQRETTAL